ncbi:MAG TPA: hypothetical protein VIM75_01245 [Ohtaekwangia sp.]|uniref:hypothetical protein n=1 Tax=Ohtaekwangia sp. TaxID=2066019 RepID=UPI002F92AB67
MQVTKTSTEPLPLPLQEAFLQFLHTTHPARLRQNLLNILFEYLIHRHHDLPVNFDTTLEHLHDLFQLLEVSGKYADQWHDQEV